MKLKCYCCGNYTLEIIFDICEVCGWHNEGLTDELEGIRGANKISLLEGRLNFIKYGMSSLKKYSLRSPYYYELPEYNLASFMQNSAAIIYMNYVSIAQKTEQKRLASYDGRGPQKFEIQLNEISNTSAFIEQINSTFLEIFSVKNIGEQRKLQLNFVQQILGELSRDESKYNTFEIISTVQAKFGITFNNVLLSDDVYIEDIAVIGLRMTSEFEQALVEWFDNKSYVPGLHEQELMPQIESYNRWYMLFIKRLMLQSSHEEHALGLASSRSLLLINCNLPEEKLMKNIQDLLRIRITQKSKGCCLLSADSFVLKQLYMDMYDLYYFSNINIGENNKFWIILQGYIDYAKIISEYYFRKLCAVDKD